MRLALDGLLNLSVGWTLAKQELTRARIRPPFELELLRRHSDDWLDALAQRLDSDRFTPSAMEIVDVPKARGLVRPIAVLVPADRVVYNALVAACFQAVRTELDWSQGKVDFAYQLSPSFPPGDWFHDQLKGWANFRRASLAALDADGGAVAFTDIAAFYENIDIATLVADLRRIGAPAPAAALLSRCLNRWAQIGGRGLPQDIGASHILAKLYLDLVDRTLANNEVRHVRYNDDIRLFLPDQQEAQHALVELARLLRRRGLSVQSAKSLIEDTDAARGRIEGHAPVLRQLRNEWIHEMLDFMGVTQEDVYPSAGEIDDALADNPDNAPIEVIRKGFRQYFLTKRRPAFDKSLFHYLLKRLSLAQDPMVLKHVRSFLVNHPEETSYLLGYIERLDAFNEMEPVLARFLRSKQGKVYPHQAYQILRWVDRLAPDELSELLPVARRYAFDPAASRHARAVARSLLGSYGDSADLERLSVGAA